MKYWEDLLTVFPGGASLYPFLCDLADSLGKPLTIFDFETSGFMGPGAFGITESATLHIMPNGQEVNGSRILTAQSLINPECKIDYHASRVTGIKQHMVKDKPHFGDSWGRPFAHFFDEHVVMGYNSKKFDEKAALRLAEQHDIDMNIPTHHVDVMMSCFGNHKVKKGKLVDFAKKYAIEVEGDAHRAMVDVFYTAGVAEALIRTFGVDAFLSYGSKTEPKKQVTSVKSKPGGQRPADIDVDLIVDVVTKLEKYQGIDDLASRLDANPSRLSFQLAALLESGEIQYEQLHNVVTQDKLSNVIHKVMDDPNCKMNAAGDYPLLKPFKEILLSRFNVDVDYIDLRVGIKNLMQDNSKQRTVKL